MLLVEDDPDRVELTLHAINRQEVEMDVEVASTGAEALEHLHEAPAGGEPPDLVLLDLQLPGIDGFEVLDEIRSTPSTRFTPVVVLTSSRAEEDRRAVYRSGANSFVSRPVDFDDLRETLRTIGQYWLGVNEVPADVDES